MAATDSTGLVSTPESYIKSAAYNMPVSPGELSGLKQPKNHMRQPSKAEAQSSRSFLVLFFKKEQRSPASRWALTL
jgi:hypothetical protein